MTKISALVPDKLRLELEKLAQANDRSVSAELRRAIAEHGQTSPPTAQGKQ
jgi:predicted transcriptional regulator